MHQGEVVNEHEKINYVEYPAKDIAATKQFFETAFGWVFVDYGPTTQLSQTKV